VPSSGVIDLAIGMIFVFGVIAALASVVTELIARFIGLRGAYLLTGLRELVDGEGFPVDLAQAEADYHNMQDLMQRSTPPAAAEPSPPPAAAESPPRPATVAALPPLPATRFPPSVTGALLGGPILSSQGMVGEISSRRLTLAPAPGPGRAPKMVADRQAGRLWSQRRSLPSYISARSFAEAVIDLVVPDAAGQTTMAAIQQGVNRLPAGIPFRTSLQALVKNADGKVDQFRSGVEHWYDDHMDRVSGWYKRNVAHITLIVGAILIVLLNINALTIAHTLYAESTVSSALSAVATKSTTCPPGQDPQDCLARLQADLSAVATAGLPIGWGTVRDCQARGARCNWMDQRGLFSPHGGSPWQLLLVLTGFLVMLIAIVPSARFWFDLLGRLGSLRLTGPKPAPPAQ
jgi:hypothetical protein